MVSPGCANCYAMLMARRLSGPGKAYEGLTHLTAHGPRWTGQVRLVPEILELPLRWRKPRLVFVNSMSDLLHEAVPDAFIAEVFAVMRKADWHEFQILTKRADRIPSLEPLIEWPENVWMGVTVENADTLHRIDRLRESGAGIKWLSVEPLLGPLPNLDLTGIDWVVVGGESGPGARPMDPAWVREVRDHCIEQDVPFFFKQWGAFGPDGVQRTKKKNGRELDGRTWDEWPKSFLARRGQDERRAPRIELDVSTPDVLLLPARAGASAGPRQYPQASVAAGPNDRDPGEVRNMSKRTTAFKAEDFEQRPILQPLAEVPRQDVEYLWEPYLPLGKLCFLDGERGYGKTWIALQVAAAVTTGAPLPGQEEGDAREPRSVIYMTQEDGLGDTLRPRLELLGADLNRIVILKGFEQGGEPGQFTLDQVNVLGDAIVQTGAVLVVIDPFLAYLPKGHHHCEGARRIATKLKELAERYGCTILGLRHLTKDGKVRGSVEIDAAARSALLVGEDALERRVMAHSKSSLAPEGVSLIYDFGAGKFEWAGESPLRWQDLLKKQKDKPRQREAGEFLEDFLARGPQAATEVQNRAAAEGLSRSTLNRSKEALGVRSYQRKRRWFWEQPDDPAREIVATVEVRPDLDRPDVVVGRLVDEPEREDDTSPDEMSAEDGLLLLTAGPIREDNDKMSDEDGLLLLTAGPIREDNDS